MDNAFAVIGHGWIRSVFYTENNEYQSFTMPGGGLLVAELLRASGCDVAPAGVPSPQRMEHLSMKRGKDGALSVDMHAGFSKGNSRLEERDADVYIAWDEGLSGFDLPRAGSVLWAAARRLPVEEQFATIRDRCFLMLPADVLRESGALISRQVSWERTATDLVWQLRYNPRFAFLHGVPDILVTFCEDGAVYIKQKGGEWQAELILTHGGFEGELREKQGLSIPDTWAVMVAEVARAWGDVGTALRLAVKLLVSGYNIDVIGNGDYGKWMEASSGSRISFCGRIPVSSSERYSDPQHWRVVDSYPGSRLYDLARLYVQKGIAAIEGMPRFCCGALTTVDRREIEAFQNIRNLIVDYAACGASRPLSIAVFGAPGSGKSFGVTQIAKNVSSKIEKLEFNVSQMTSRNDLAAAFHQVRDAALSGKLPLVFFDEFDSDRDGRRLGWLKSFLMPMQDGKFMDDIGEHPVGRCVMVFAGGTCATFEEFSSPMTSADSAAAPAFKAVKGPDFVSRLRGVIDILGPNPSEVGEQGYLLRRAILLRSLLERKLNVKPGDMTINGDILHAMLLVPQYKHGARSMEAILDMSRLAGTSWEPASLPFLSQLAIHVDADAFIRLLLKDVILNAFTEKLAKAIHEDFMAKAIHEKYTKDLSESDRHNDSSFGGDWEGLPEEIKDSNRQQALNIPQKLLSVGCGFDTGDAPYPTLEAFTPDEVFRLAQDEHRRWMAEKLSNGWKYGPVRDNAGKIHHLLVDWEELPQEEKQKDINVAENIIPLLKMAGLRVYRMT